MSFGKEKEDEILGSIADRSNEAVAELEEPINDFADGLAERHGERTEAVAEAMDEMLEILEESQETLEGKKDEDGSLFEETASINEEFEDLLSEINEARSEFFGENQRNVDRSLSIAKKLSTRLKAMA